MELRLLGAMEAHVGDTAVRLGPRQRRLVLAVLALEASRPVPLDRLIDLVWPSRAPRTAGHAIRVCVSELRRALSESGAETTVLTQGSGYLLLTDRMGIDVHRFGSLVERARAAADDTVRVELLDEALELWRGPALDGTADPETRDRLFSGLEETRLVAVEDRFDALLRLGGHSGVVGALTTAVETYPTRERLVSQLMRALHRGGRTSEALAVARRTRERFADELGIDPSEELQQLELAILRGEPGPGGETAPAPVPVPAMLPPMVADFTGRAEHMSRLDESFVGATVITGTAGVGKTALAVRWAHAVRDRFPDGQLYVNLRGHAPGQPEQALQQFLHAIGVPPERMPVGMAEATGLYRSLLADRKVLVLLDNAASPEQVRPLLPAGPACAVVITSRDRLDGLFVTDAARRVELGVLSRDESVALLGRMLGEGRVAAEPTAAARLTETCAGLPLALRIAAAHLACRPGYRIADYLAEMHSGDLLESFQIVGDEPTAVRAAFDLSYTALKPDARRLFRLLGHTPGPDISTASAVALDGRSRPETARTLDRLTAEHLLDQHRPGRYTCHDLLRHYARDRAEDEGGADERTAGLNRLFAHYLRLARAAAGMLYPHLLQVPFGDTSEFDSDADALAWLDAERPVLVTAVCHAHRYGPWETAWLLADALRGYFYLRRDFSDWFAVARTALAAAGAQGGSRARAAAHYGLGTAYYSVNQYDEAIAEHTAALALCRETGWCAGEAAVLMNLGQIAESRGDLDKAASHYGRALEVGRTAGEGFSEEMALVRLGVVEQYRGRLDRAAERYEQALAICREVSASGGQGVVYCHLGASAYLQGRLDVAAAYCRQALAYCRGIGARNDEAHVLTYLAKIHRESGRYGEAFADGYLALSLAADTGCQRTEAMARIALAGVHDALGEHAQASAHFERSLRIAREIGARHEECEALLGLAAGLFRDGEPARGRAYMHEALALAREGGYRLLEERSLSLLTTRGT